MTSPLQIPIIQIAGIIDQAEAKTLQECGVRYLGFPLRVPIHRQDLTDEHAAAIIRQIKPPNFGVLITYLANAAEIAEFCRFLGAPIVQLHGDLPVDELKKLKALSPELTVIKSLVVGYHPIEKLEWMISSMSSCVDAFITDTFDPITGASGATGKTHDWRLSKRLVERSDRPVILAGGLTPDNVRSAILEVKPAGVDAHTGVEDRSGRKNQEKVKKFVAEAALGFQLASDVPRPSAS
jgi:phosphoribosylanthranilate isomerase